MKKLATAAIALTAALALAAPAAQAAAPNFNTAKTYRITDSWSLVLEIAGASRGDGAALTQWPVNGGTHQQWKFEWTGVSNQYRVRNVNSQKCITRPGGAVAPRTKVVQWTCDQTYRAGQDWTVWKDSGSTYSHPLITLSVPGADAVLDLPAGTPYWGAQLQLWPSIDSAATQTFLLNPID